MTDFTREGSIYFGSYGICTLTSKREKTIKPKHRYFFWKIAQVKAYLWIFFIFFLSLFFFFVSLREILGRKHVVPSKVL